MAVYATVNGHSATAMNRNDRGTPLTPVAAKVATTLPASTVIGADADTVKKLIPAVPRLPRSKPAGALLIGRPIPCVRPPGAPARPPPPLGHSPGRIANERDRATAARARATLHAVAECAPTRTDPSGFTHRWRLTCDGA